MSELVIVPAAAADGETLAAFNVALADESEGLKLDPPTVLAGVRALLADAGKGRYFVARDAAGDEPIGQIMVTVEWSDWRNGPLWWVQSVYVRPDRRRRGVFTALLRHVVDAARAAGCPAVRLYVEEHNAAARATYAALGLKDSGYVVMEQLF